ncbi:uncharacterized protein [Odocoileus virginianus]|uniref:Uncharacterized protein n=1 Tax=Odocoileus virginianus TaxID=9874 RepID=A0ABM4GWH2_ODOVR
MQQDSGGGAQRTKRGEGGEKKNVWRGRGGPEKTQEKDGDQQNENKTSLLTPTAEACPAPTPGCFGESTWECEEGELERGQELQRLGKGAEETRRLRKNKEGALRDGAGTELKLQRGKGAPAPRLPPPPTASSSSRQTGSPRLQLAPPGPPRRGHYGLPLANVSATLRLPRSLRRRHWSGSVVPRPYRPPSVPLQNPATPALPSKRSQVHLVAAAAVLPPLPWRRIPAHGQKLTPSLAESAVAPGETRVWVGLFGYKKREGGFRRLQSPRVIGWPWSDSCFHWLRSPPVTVRVTPSLSLSLAKPSATRGRKQESHGRRAGVNARALLFSLSIPPTPNSTGPAVAKATKLY